MIHLLDLSYRNEVLDGRISRAEAQAWMAEKRQLGRSGMAEEVMAMNLEQYGDIFEPGVKEEVSAFLQKEQRHRLANPTLWDRFASFFA